jgi:molecular chaperone IbpA
MSLLTRYTTSNFVNLLDEIYNNNYFERGYFNNKSRTTQLNDNQIQLEIELAGYSKEQIQVYTEKNSLYVVAKTDKNSSSRQYARSWSISENEKVSSVKYENGLLLIVIDRIPPQEPLRTNYKIE